MVLLSSPTASGFFKHADYDENRTRSFDAIDIIKRCYEDHSDSADIELITLTGIQFYKTPFEEGKNIGAVELIYNRHGHRAIYGLYDDGSIRLFAD